MKVTSAMTFAEIKIVAEKHSLEIDDLEDSTVVIRNKGSKEGLLFYSIDEAALFLCGYASGKKGAIQTFWQLM